MSGSTISKRVESVAIGFFDGMHRGHQALFRRLGANGAIVVIDRGGASLTPGFLRCRYTNYPCYFFELEEIKDLDAKGFAALLRRSFPNLKRIVVGYDFAFGKDRRYLPKDLEPFFEVEVVDEVQVDGISVHSRVIKELLHQGRVKEAAKLLGRYYAIEGEVVYGQGVGKKELVPTINLLVREFLLPKDGVYATFSIIEERCYKSVTFIGKRVTLDGSFSIESHILDEEVPRPKEMKILFVEYLRSNRRFATLKGLKQTIEQDIQKAKEVFNEEGITRFLGVDGALCKELYQ